MKTDCAWPELVISCIKTNPSLSLLTPNIKWVSHPSLSKPAISTSKRLLISEVPSEARWVGRCKQVSRQVPEITQPKATCFNLAALSKGVFKDYIHWTIINMDLITSRTRFAEEKNTKCQTHLASILYLAIILISVEFLSTYCKMTCLGFVLNNSISCYAEEYTARVHRVDTWIVWEYQTSNEQIWVSNSKSSTASSRLPAPVPSNRCTTIMPTKLCLVICFYIDCL